MGAYSLSGTGTHAVSANTTAIHVTITTLPATSGQGRANPANAFDVGLLRFGDGTGYWAPVAIVGGPQWLPVPAGTTILGFSMLHGAVASVDEVINGTLPFGGGGSSSASSGLGGAEPGSPAAGDLYLPTTGGPWVERYSGSAWSPWGPLYPLTKPPLAATWSWVNQGSALVADMAGGGLYLSSPSNGPGVHLNCLVRAAPATPYVISAAFLFDLDNGAASPSMGAGLVFRNAAAGTLHTWYAEPNDEQYFLSRKWNSPTSFSANYNTSGPSCQVGSTGVFFLRIADNGTSRICSSSRDGQNWRATHTVARTDFLTADQVGIFLRTDNGFCAMTLLSWAVS